MHYPRFALAVTLAFLGACTGPALKHQGWHISPQSI